MKLPGSLSEADRKKAKSVIIGIPFDRNAFKRGAKYGPKAIRRAARKIETFLWGSKTEVSKLFFYDLGDIEIEGGDRGYERICERIEEKMEEKGIGTEVKRVFIGGDHSISFPIVKHFAENMKNIKVVSIDAHADFRDSYKGKRFSNACVMRRIAELVGFENVIEIGVRSASEDEYSFFKDKIRVYDGDMLKEEGVEFILHELKRHPLYLSIDIDVLDPSIAPGVENPEPCGLSLESLISLIKGIIRNNEVEGCDVVEVNPKMDARNEITSINAARIIYEILESMSRS
ncbi:MAG: agmatinase [Candidatus Methanospirareceae archaeon]